MNKAEWIKKLKPYWEAYCELESEFFDKVNELETKMIKECKEPNLEFAYSKYGGGLEIYFGVGFQGDGKKREPNLIHGHDLK